MTTGLLVAVIVACFSFGDVSLARGMRRVGGISSLKPGVLLNYAGRVIRSPFVLLGTALQIVAFTTFLIALSREDLSYVFPLTAASDIVTVLAAKYILREQVSRTRWAGVIAISIGIALISVS